MFLRAYLFLKQYILFYSNGRSLVVRASGTKSGGRGFESHIGHDGDFFCNRPQPRVSSAQAQWIGLATDRDSSTYGCDFGGRLGAMTHRG